MSLNQKDRSDTSGESEQKRKMDDNENPMQCVSLRISRFYFPIFLFDPFVSLLAHQKVVTAVHLYKTKTTAALYQREIHQLPQQHNLIVDTIKARLEGHQP